MARSASSVDLAGSPRLATEARKRDLVWPSGLAVDTLMARRLPGRATWRNWRRMRSRTAASR